MGLKRRISDASYWVYNHGRHRAAFAAAGQPGTAPDFAALHNAKYALLVTFRRDGTGVPTPVWFALLDDGRLVTRTEERTAKVRRIRTNPHAIVYPCDARGKPLGPGVEGAARILTDDRDTQQAEAALDRHYGRLRRVYEKVMEETEGMVYLEIVALPPAAPG